MTTRPIDPADPSTWPEQFEDPADIDARDEEAAQRRLLSHGRTPWSRIKREVNALAVERGWPPYGSEAHARIAANRYVAATYQRTLPPRRARKTAG
jgi:hypothetical protein